MSNLIPVPAPALQPLAQSFEFDALETELKQSFMAVYESMIRPRERNLNLYGMAHLGSDDLMASALKADGIAMVKRSSTRMQFLMKANRSRNPRRGLLFIKRYLQAIWPNIWQAEPLWLRLNDTANYPANAIPLTSAVAVAPTITGDYTDGSGTPVMLYRDEASGRYPLLPYARTNYVQNNAMVGAANGSWGSAGTKPTRWTSAGFTSGLQNGLTVTTTGVGTKNGITYIRVTITGTPTATTGFWFRPETGQSILAALGQTWTSSMFLEVVSDTGLNSITHTLYESNSAGTAVKNSPLTLDSTKYKQALGAYRPSVTRTLTDPTTTAIFGQTAFNYTINVPVNVDVLIGMPQIEPGAIASLPIPTNNTGAVTFTDYTVNAATGVATFRAGLGVAATCIHYFLTGRVRVTLPVSSDNGLGLTEIAKAFRSTLPARLMLEFKLGTQFDTSGATGLQIANGAVGIMPFTATGTLQL